MTAIFVKFLKRYILFAFACSDIMCLSMGDRVKLDTFCSDMRDIFKFQKDEDFTLKWLDEEGIS